MSIAEFIHIFRFMANRYGLMYSPPRSPTVLPEYFEVLNLPPPMPCLGESDIHQLHRRYAKEKKRERDEKEAKVAAAKNKKKFIETGCGHQNITVYTCNKNETTPSKGHNSCSTVPVPVTNKKERVEADNEFSELPDEEICCSQYGCSQYSDKIGSEGEELTQVPNSVVCEGCGNT